MIHLNKLKVKGSDILMYFEVTEIPIDYTSTTNEEWKKIISVKLKSASSFEIHCWNEEQAEIEMALQHGRIKKNRLELWQSDCRCRHERIC